MQLPRNAISRIILLFWSSWFTLVFASNLVDGLQEAGIVPAGWTFSSGNFALILETISIYHMPKGVAVFLFFGVLIIEVLAASAFWRATFGQTKAADVSFSLAIGLFAGFIIADELFIVYDRIGDLETSHFVVLCALLLSLLIIRLLPEGRET